jgi:hypothetical protein
MSLSVVSSCKCYVKPETVDRFARKARVYEMLRFKRVVSALRSPINDMRYVYEVTNTLTIIMLMLMIHID